MTVGGAGHRRGVGGGRHRRRQHDRARCWSGAAWCRCGRWAPRRPAAWRSAWPVRWATPCTRPMVRCRNSRWATSTCRRRSGVAAASVLAAPYGTQLAHRLDGQTLKRVFAGFLVVGGGQPAARRLTRSAVPRPPRFAGSGHGSFAACGRFTNCLQLATPRCRQPRCRAPPLACLAIHKNSRRESP